MHLGPEDRADKMTRMQQPGSAGKKQEMLSGKKREGEVFKDVFPDRLIRRKEDADWNESGWLAVTRVFCLW